MNKYELAVVLSSAITDEERAAALEKVQGFITRAGGSITAVDDWGKKKLAYEIQKMSEGYYTFIRFEAEASAPAQVEENVRLTEQVIRFLCVSLEE